MNRLSQLGLAVAFVLLNGPLLSGQVLRPTDSLARQLLLFDSNGNGRIDPAERKAMQPQQESVRPIDTGLPLICEGEASGGAGGGGSAASERNHNAIRSAEGAKVRRELHRLANQPERKPEEPRAKGEVAESEDSSELTPEGYPISEPEPSEPEPLRRSLGLSKAVQYRLLHNRRPSPSQPSQYRQAAVFGATQGLVKNDYRVAVEDHCAPSRASIYCRLHFSR